MAITRVNRRPGALLDAVRTIFDQKLDKLDQALARRSVYRQTVFELSSLNDKDLADIGISRCGIRQLAKEAAYGCQ